MNWVRLGIIHQELYSLRNDYFLIIFGVTTGLLVLIGFSAFYVVMHNQQKLEKIREVYSKLAAGKYLRYRSEQVDQTIESFYYYQQLLDKRGDYSQGILLLVRIALWFILISWLVTIGLVDSTIELLAFGVFYSICGCIMLALTRILKKIHRAYAKGEFPKPERLLDACEKTEVDAIQLASMMSQLELRTGISKAVRFGLPVFQNSAANSLYFKNFKIYHPVLNVRHQEGRSSVFHAKPKTLKQPTDKSPMGSIYNWFELEWSDAATIQHLEAYIEVDLFLACADGHDRQVPGEINQGMGIRGYWLKYRTDLAPNQRILLSPYQMMEGFLSLEDALDHGEHKSSIIDPDKTLQLVN